MRAEAKSTARTTRGGGRLAPRVSGDRGGAPSRLPRRYRELSPPPRRPRPKPRPAPIRADRSPDAARRFPLDQRRHPPPRAAAGPARRPDAPAPAGPAPGAPPRPRLRAGDPSPQRYPQRPQRRLHLGLPRRAPSVRQRRRRRDPCRGRRPAPPPARRAGGLLRPHLVARLCSTPRLRPRPPAPARLGGPTPVRCARRHVTREV